MTNITYTVALVKAPSVGRGDAGPILELATKAGLIITALQYKVLCSTEIAAFYTAHYGKPYYPDLEASVGHNKPIVAAVLASVTGDAVQIWRDLIGATKSSTAAPGTIRSKFGGHRYLGDAAPIADNAVHGSDSARAAAYEYKILFGKSWPENPIASLMPAGA